MKILGIILARSGSKRIPHKNKKNLGNKKLFCWTLDKCKKLPYVNNVIVSTDDNLIYNISKKRGFLVPWLRPKRLATDKSTSYSACAHAIRWYEKNISKIDAILLLQVTSPFRTKKSIINSIDLYKKFKKPIVSIKKISKKKFDNEKYVYQINNNNKIIIPKKNSKGDLYKITGSIYLWPKKTLLKDKFFKFKGAHGLVINNKKQSLDIDLSSDWNTALKFLK